MPLRYRPFGVVGSTLEVLAGLEALRSVLWTDEPYPGWIVTLGVVIGALLISVGIFGVAARGQRSFPKT
jgi:hypothetical protein